MIRDKKRYILIEASRDLNLRKEELDKLFKQSIMNVVGQLHYYDVSPKVVSVIGERRFVLRCKLKGYENAIIAISLIKKLGSGNTGFYTLKSSGTIKTIMDSVKQ